MSFLIQFGSRTHGIVWKLQKYFSEGGGEVMFILEFAVSLVFWGEVKFCFIKEVSKKYVSMYV